MKNKHDPEWAKAKKLCRLNQEDIRMAKELGFRPRSLMKNIPDKSQRWKAPVKIWIRDLYEKKQWEMERRKPVKAQNAPVARGKSKRVITPHDDPFVGIPWDPTDHEVPEYLDLYLPAEEELMEDIFGAKQSN